MIFVAELTSSHAITGFISIRTQRGLVVSYRLTMAAMDSMHVMGIIKLSHVPEINGMDYPSMAYTLDGKPNRANQLLAVSKVQADSFISSSQTNASVGGVLGLLSFIPSRFLPASLATASALPYLRGGLVLGAGVMLYKSWQGMKQLSRGMQDMVQDQLLRRMFFGPYGDPYQPRQGTAPESISRTALPPLPPDFRR